MKKQKNYNLKYLEVDFVEEKDIYDEIICKKILSLILAVQSHYDFIYDDITINKELNIISEEEYLKEIRGGTPYKETIRYYISLCNEELEKLGFTSSNADFEKIFTFNKKILNEMCEVEYQDLAPYITKYLIPKEQYEEIKEKLKEEREIKFEQENS